MPRLQTTALSLLLVLGVALGPWQLSLTAPRGWAGLGAAPVSPTPAGPIAPTASADLVPPLTPSGNFATSVWPRGELLVSNSHEYYLTSFYRAGPEFLWETLTDPMAYANKTALALSPNFAQDRFLLLGTDYGTNALRLSFDGGRHWESPAAEVTGPIRSIVFSPAFAVD